MMSTADSWESKFPHPGAAPEKPDKASLFGDSISHAYNKWVTAMRKHNIAKAVDTLTRKEKLDSVLDAVETIALTTGIMLLEGSIKEVDISNPFSAFFG